MSKASEWARRMADTQAAHEEAVAANPGPWSLRLGQADVIREFCLSGQAVEMLIDLRACNGRIQVRQDEALAFAKWILDTFEDKL